MRVAALGGAREIGRSAFLVNDDLLLDYGMDSGTPPQYPVAEPEPTAVVLTHGHLDHVGTVPALLSGDSRPPIHCTQPTLDLLRLLARDTLKLHGGTYDCPFTAADIARLGEVAVTHEYGEPFEAASHEVTLFDAGHIPGSSHVLVDDGASRLFYTGDYHTGDQHLVSGTTARPPADAVMTESTYANTEHPSRAQVEREFVDTVRSTLWDGGTVVVPAFAIGRTQEVLSILAANDIDCYVDGLGTRVTELLMQPRNRSFLDAARLRRARSNARTVDGRDGQRERIAAQSTVIVTTSGMLHGGPAMTYVPAIAADPTNAILLTGFQVPGTPGRALLERGSAEIGDKHLSVSATVEQYNLSAHADRSGLMSFLADYPDAAIQVVHGDRCVEFAYDLAASGYAASAPENVEVLEIE